MVFEPRPEGKCPSDLAEAAERYADLGIGIIPIRAGTKKPAVRWKRYQRERPGRPTLRRWFRRGDVTGIAAVLGRASRGLACRDYDREGAYQEWARRHPDLADSLPTVATARGFHV